jgi:DNA invertase Pin-like site-specific DNA recombinase
MGYATVHRGSIRQNTDGDTSVKRRRIIQHASNVFGALAEFERDLIRERTQAGLAAARVRGRLGGRPKALDEKKLALAISTPENDSVRRGWRLYARQILLTVDLLTPWLSAMVRQLQCVIPAGLVCRVASTMSTI